MQTKNNLYNIDIVQRVEYPEDIQFIVIDLFCGAGGTSTGISLARNKRGNPIALVAACVNHDPDAIDSHWANHPQVAHFEEDITTLKLSPLVDIVNAYREVYPNAKVVLWASLECTNFSKAKGGQARDADSRTLAYCLYRYIDVLNPDYIQIENVVEFLIWGPLDKNGKPIEALKGTDYEEWRNNVLLRGYKDEWVTINSADLGARTSRNRLFGCFARPELEILWPKATHSKKGGNGLKKWNPVKPLLELNDQGLSIFERKTPLVDNTLKRLISGIEKYHNDPACIIKNYGGHPKSKAVSLDKPLGTITTKDSHSLAFMLKYYGTGKNISSINEPLGTIPTKDRFSLCWLDKQYSGKHNHSSIGSPAGTIMVSDKHQLVNAMIYNPSHGGHFMHPDQPCPTIIARQDKAPLYLVFTEQNGGDLTKRWVKKGDSMIMMHLKSLMFKYNLFDVKTRMLYARELKIIQGFPVNYQLMNGSTAAKKGIGNSVVPLVCKLMYECYAKL